MYNIQNAPVILFVYNRPDHTMQTLNALDNNIDADKSELYIFSDYAKNNQDIDAVLKVRAILREFEKKSHFKKVHICEAKEHKGLAGSVITGVSEIISQYGQAIVLEDDLVTSIDFLKFMNGALRYYEAEEKVWSIAGYTPDLKCLSKYKKDVYMCLRAGSWGWATWKDRWDSVDWEVKDYADFIGNKKKRKQFKKRGYNLPDMLESQMQGRIDSWAIRFCYEQFKQDKITVNPTVSRIRNIGFDGTGTHGGISEKWNVHLNEKKQDIHYIPIEMNKKLINSYYTFFAGNVVYRNCSDLKSILNDLLRR